MNGKTAKLIRKHTRNLEKTETGLPNRGVKNFRKMLKKMYNELNWIEKTNWFLKKLPVNLK